MRTLTLRNIPEELYEKIHDQAVRERRSMGGQILTLIERGLRPSADRVQEAVAYFQSRPRRHKGLGLKLIREDRRR